MRQAQYRAWLERGLAHQRESLALDALLCFRQAMRIEPSAFEPWFHLGEVLWQLGRTGEALQAWREAGDRDAAALPPRVALAEASLMTGDVEGARGAARAALALAPNSRRVRLVSLIADIDSPDAPTLTARCAEAAALLEAEPDLLRIEAVAAPLAIALERLGSPGMYAVEPVVIALRRALADPERMRAAPASLLAFAAEAGAFSDSDDACWREMLARSYRPLDFDAVRRLACAAQARRRAEAASFARTYGELCRVAHPPRMPLTWPRRTAGRLRVIALASEESLRAFDHELRALLAHVVVALLADATALEVASAGCRIVAIGAHPRESAARLLASLDADAIVDTVGLHGDVGPLLVQRPARRVVSATRVVPAWSFADRAVSSLAELAGHGIDSDTDVPSPAAMAALLDEAVRLHRDGDRDAALAGYDRVLAIQPESTAVLYLRGALRRDRHEDATALDDFRAALTIAPEHLEARIAAARTALDIGDPHAVLELVRDRLEPSAACAPLWQATGLALIALGDAQTAAQVLADAARLDPNNADAHYNHGVALQASGRAGDAARAFQRALTLRPELTAAEFNLGVLFQQQKRHDAAIAAYGNVLRADPRHVQAYKNLGEVLFDAGRLDAWRANFERFESQCPDSLTMVVQALEVCQHFALHDRIEHHLDGLRHERHAARTQAELVDALEELLYLLLFFDVEPELVHRLSLTYDAAAHAVYGAPIARSPERKPGRVRIGYLSADLRDHVMGKMMWEVIRRHDRNRFEVVLYSTSPSEDAWTARWRELGDRFVSVAGDSDARAVERIGEDDLDLLVDLSTHTRGARPGILARKPARVQLTHVASAGALGLSAIDFKLTDGNADVAAAQEYMIERMLPVAGCIYPYRHVPPADASLYRRDAFGVAADAIVLGAFVTPMKLSRRCLRLWADVMRKLPEAVIAISPMRAELTSSFLRLFASAGIARDRVIVVPQGRDERENQARYRLVDFVLDPMPFGGVNGTLEALDMHVPVVTLCGGRHGERTSFSILASLGVTDTVAASGPEYITIAERLAREPAFRASVRARIQEGLRESTLTEMDAHVRHLEDAYMAALRDKAPAWVEAGVQ